MKLVDRKSSSVIGLDIGSGAVRAVELSRTRKGLTLRRFGQVGLPSGVIVDGEVVNPALATASLRRLWSEGGFSSRNVVLAVSGQRVIVRQAEVLAMSEGEFRSALAFQATELIPIPVDDAQLDFVILPPADGASKHGAHMQIVLAAAHRRVLAGQLTVLRDASIRAVAIDPAPMAVARAVGRSRGGQTGTVAVVDVGADLTVITVVAAGSVRFSRILDIGGSALTTRLAERHSVGQGEAESMKRQAGQGLGTGTDLVEDLDPLVSEIESSLAFFASQVTGSPIEEVLLTGGATRDPGLVRELARRMPVPLQLLDPLDRVDCGDLDLDEEGRRAASATCLVALGTAEWAWESAGRRLSLLPREMAAAAQMRRRVAVAGIGLVVVAGGLAAASLDRTQQVDAQRKQVAVATETSDGLATQLAALQPVEATSSAIQQRLAVVDASAQGDIDWSKLLDEITAAMPAKLHLTVISFTGPGDTSSGASTSAVTPAGAAIEGGSGPLGAVTMGVTGDGTEEQVAVWLRAFRHVPGLEYVWIPSAQAGAGKVTFTSTGGLTGRVPKIDRTPKVGAHS